MAEPRRRVTERCLVGVLLLLLLVSAGPAPASAAEEGLIRLDVTIGKSQVLELKEPFTRVSVTNPGIADVFVITPNQILINGKAGCLNGLCSRLFYWLDDGLLECFNRCLESMSTNSKAFYLKVVFDDRSCLSVSSWVKRMSSDIKQV